MLLGPGDPYARAGVEIPRQANDAVHTIVAVCRFRSIIHRGEHADLGPQCLAGQLCREDRLDDVASVDQPARRVELLGPFRKKGRFSG